VVCRYDFNRSAAVERYRDRRQTLLRPCSTEGVEAPKSIPVGSSSEAFVPLALRVREPVIFKAGWLLSLYPAAAEAGGTLVYSHRKSFPGRRGAAQDGERSRLEAARRARGKLRRYCAANGLNRLGTLTYAPPFCTDPHQVRADVAVFFRGLRAGLGGKALPYVWVPELHADGQRFHVHFAVGRFVARGLIESVWGHGFVHIKLLGDLPVGSGRLGEARAAAGWGRPGPRPVTWPSTSVRLSRTNPTAGVPSEGTVTRWGRGSPRWWNASPGAPPGKFSMLPATAWVAHPCASGTPSRRRTGRAPRRCGRSGTGDHRRVPAVADRVV